MVDILVDNDFTNVVMGTLPDQFKYFKLVDSSAEANQGYFLSTPNGTTVGAVPATFEDTANGTSSHVQYGIVYNRTFSPPDKGQLVVETTMSARQVNVKCNPFPLSLVPNPNSDPRLVSGVSFSLDPSSLLYTAISFTNETIYALYVILPFNKPSYGGTGPDYAAFSSLIPIASRTANELATVAMTYDKECNRISYLVNGQVRYRTPILGHYPEEEYVVNNYGGPPKTVSLDKLIVGFGVLTLLDHSLPGSCNKVGLLALDNPSLYAGICGCPARFSNIPNIPSNRLWGQGAILNLKRQTIYTVR